MSRAAEDQSFACEHCGFVAPRHPDGSYRNHCPRCLYSLHVDRVPGDRASQCQAPMAPAGMDYSGKKGHIIVHRCTRCGHESRNKTASDDSLDAIVELQKQSIANLPPF